MFSEKRDVMPIMVSTAMGRFGCCFLEQRRGLRYDHDCVGHDASILLQSELVNRFSITCAAFKVQYVGIKVAYAEIYDCALSCPHREATTTYESVGARATRLLLQQLLLQKTDNAGYETKTM